MRQERSHLSTQGGGGGATCKLVSLKELARLGQEAGHLSTQGGGEATCKLVSLKELARLELETGHLSTQGGGGSYL